MKHDIGTEVLHDRLFLPLAIPLLLAVLPHARHLPVWIIAYFIALTALRYTSIVSKIRLPGRALRAVLTLTTLAAVYLSFGTLQGRSAGVGLLVALLGLKLLELHSKRDAYLTIFVGLFVIVTNFLFTESIPMVVYMLCITALFIAALISLNDPDQTLALGGQLRASVKLLAQAAPLMLILFILYPRIPGPLWGMPEDAHAARTGLSEQMSPGNISQLSQSDEVAFRVKFTAEPPAQKLLYWRGPVLWHTNGRTWDKGYRNEGHSPEIIAGGDAWNYTITLEPHGKHWIFALDLPMRGPPNTYMTSDLKLLDRKPVNHRKRYSLTSYTDYRISELSERDREIGVQLPPDMHSAARGLARQWRLETDNDRDLIAKALNYFRDNPFYYTLNPPLLTGDSVDDFLFGTRRGFCEHYAAAFTVLMRAAGLPARVVTGYQGGEFNPLGDYLIVRQRDAHAWSEVWLDSQGWTRIDPTAAVAPSRVEAGIDTALPLRTGTGLLDLSLDTTMGRLWLRMHQRWDAVNNGWNQWVLAYGPELQGRLLIRAGLGNWNWREISAGLVTLLLGSLTILAWILSRPTRSTDPCRAKFDEFCRRLARRGIVRQVFEGPLDFAGRASKLRPDLKASINRITELYVDLRYGRGRHDLKELNHAVRQFRP